MVLTMGDPWQEMRTDARALGLLLAAIREHAGHSTRQAAEHCLMDPPTLSRIERGMAVPTPHQATWLSQYVMHHGTRRQQGRFDAGVRRLPVGPSPARHTDPDTSAAAARSITAASARRVHWALLELLLAQAGMGMVIFPTTHENIRKAYNARRPIFGWPIVSESGLRTRSSEMVRAGWVEDTGRRGWTSSGRRAIVWGLTAAGREAWNNHNERTDA